ncbi:TetR/AcrR family transcriptional regulator [Halopseudomonas nanhaiensis]|uniref:TetR/AcrR family transcriptional regulator n=1 Tax=Halopseudomonas nanhaiensis TaxID=2830842 RepID=UPI001CBD74EB|nr:TetR/AcrR family transcriptional regulator [Halopseudomonas nanhaiensis]UAW97113.1 TetR/AcrR family transcriptional regulator [Halopseudomonas nanhaiensis]
MSVDERREREKQERRGSILDAAEEVFFTKGYDKCSMDEIAKTAQLSRALLYVYFRDKAAIMRGIMLRSVACLRDRFVRAISEAELGLDQVGAFGRAYYDFSREESHYFDVLTQINTFPHLSEEDEHSAALQCCAEEVMGLMVEALQRGVADGSLSAERVRDPMMTAYYLRGALHGVIMETRQPDKTTSGLPDADALICYTIDALGQSLRP